ncbi:unnamed protein product, partial [Didymodactylos carnosus]
KDGIHFRADSLFIDMKHLLLSSNSNSHRRHYHQGHWGGSYVPPTIYRLCICNTSFLLLRSSPMNSCPLC